MSAERNYPIPAPEDDPRFTFGFTLELAQVIERHGFPKLTGPDLVQLQMAMYRMIYTREDT